MFEKKTVIFKKKDRETWQQIRELLKAEGFKGVSATHYFGDTVAAGGCGAKLDPRAFGGGKVVDRDIYRIAVRESDKAQALNTLRAHGIVPIVDETVDTDIALKINNRQ